MEFIKGSLYINDKNRTSGTLVVLCTGNISDIAFEGVVVQLASFDESIGYEKWQYKDNFAKDAFILSDNKIILKNRL